MKPAYVLNDEERKIRHEKRTGKTAVTQTPNLPVVLNDNMTEDEMMVFIQMQSRWKNYIAQQITIFYETNPKIFKAIGK